MDSNNPVMDHSDCTTKDAGPSGALSNINFTTETLRLELRDGDQLNHVLQDSAMAQANILVSQAQQKKKTPCFQITSVVFNHGGEESPDETEDVSDILESSKFTSDIEQETPSFSEEFSKSEDVGVPGALPASSQYGITAVVQQNESGGLLTSRLPQGITVNVTKGGIALAEADGAVTSDSENLSNRFKIVKIASNKPFKKGRWVCFDFMDSPATSTVGVRTTDSAHDISIPLAPAQQNQAIINYGQQAQQQSQTPGLAQLQQQTQPQQHQQYPITSQTGNVQQGTVPFTSQMSSQGFNAGAGGQSVPLPSHGQQTPQICLQQQQQQLHQQLLQQQQQIQQQQQMQQQQTQSSVMTSQVLDNQPVGAQAQQSSISSISQQSSPILQVNAVTNIQQQIQNQPPETLQKQATQQSMSQQVPAQNVPSQLSTNQQLPSQQQSSQVQQQQFQPQISQQQQQQQFQQQNQQQPSQQIQQQSSQQIQQQSSQQIQQQSSQQIQQQSSQQIQHQIQQLQQHQQQQQIPSSQTSATSAGQDQMPMLQDYSPSSHACNVSQQPIQQQQNVPQQSHTTMQQQQPSTQLQHPQQQTSASPSSSVSSDQTSAAPLQVTSSISNYSSMSGLVSVANLSSINISSMINSHVTSSDIGVVSSSTADISEALTEPMAAGEDGAQGEENKQSASSASTVAIDNKIEQAMDLVKSHLMLAVREEVDVLKERIGELMERINHLEYENSVLKKYATPETLQQIQHSGSNP